MRRSGFRDQAVKLTVTTEPLRTAVQNLVTAANAHRGRQPAEAFRNALNALVTLDGNEAAEKRLQVAAALADVTSPNGAGIIAVWLGAAVEGGADPFPHVQSLLDCLLRFSRQVDTEEEVAEIDEELAIGLEFLGQGLVAHLSRDPRSLRALQANEVLLAELERVESYSAGPMWILELVRKVSGSLVVLHGEQPVGTRVEYRNISNCFHLFTLLQAALADLMPGAREIASDTIAVARGEYQATCSDEAWWHYGQPVDGPPNLVTSVFGEQSPQEIGLIDGQQVMLLWPPLLGSRAWNSGFFEPALHAAPADVQVIEMLSAQAVAMWRLRLGLPDGDQPSAKSWWWPFW